VNGLALFCLFFCGGGVWSFSWCRLRVGCSRVAALWDWMLGGRGGGTGVGVHQHADVKRGLDGLSVGCGGIETGGVHICWRQVANRIPCTSKAPPKAESTCPS